MNKEYFIKNIKLWNWNAYRDNHSDLNYKSEEFLLKHVLKHGIKENRNITMDGKNRICDKTIIKNFNLLLPTNFDYKGYINLYNDLQHMNETAAKLHYILCGNYEGRICVCNVKISKVIHENTENNTEDNNYINVMNESETKIFSLNKKEFVSDAEVNNKISNIFLYIKNLNISNSEIIRLYELFNMCYCDILCPSINVNNIMYFFGGYILNNKIFLINDEYFKHYDKYHEQYYNKQTDVIFKNCFITNNKEILNNITNNEYIFQYTQFKAIVSPFINLNINHDDLKQQIFDTNICVNDKYSFINKDMIIENSLSQSKYFIGNLFFKRNKSVLICENSILTPNKDCGSLYMTEFIQSLLKLNYDVHFFSGGNFCYLDETEYFKKLGVCVHYNRDKYKYKSFENFLKLNSSYFEYIFLSRSDICCKYKEAVRKYSPNSKIIYVTHDISHLRIKDNKQKAITKKKEMENIEYCDLSLIVSTDEMNYLNEHISTSKLFYYPILYNSNDSIRLPMKERKDIYFIGSIHTPNIEALDNFLENIWPLINKQNQNIIFHIIGNVSSSLKKNHDNVKVYGCIDNNDLFYLIKKCRLNVVPLLSGGGVKGKVLQSMNMMTPVISSKIGVQGLPLQDNIDFILINPFENYNLCADKIISAYNNIDLLERCCTNSKKYFEQHCSSKNNRDYNDKLFSKLDIIKKPNVNIKYNCIVLCVVFKYKDIIEFIKNFFEKQMYDIKFTFYFIINNNNIFDELKNKYSNIENIYILEGDNSFYDFSGFSKAVSYLKENNIFDSYDCITLTNETLLTNLPTEHIYYNVNNDLFNNICTNKNAVSGLLDSHGFEFTIHDRKINKWLRGNFIAMNLNVLKKINYKIQYFDLLSIYDDKNNFKINISCNYLDKINLWLSHDKYKDIHSDNIIKNKKMASIINEAYLSSVLMDFEVYKFDR